MSKICYNKEKINQDIIIKINKLIEELDSISKQIVESSIPSDFLYYDSLISFKDSIALYQSSLKNIIDNINKYGYELSSNEQIMLKQLSTIDETIYSLKKV